MPRPEQQRIIGPDVNVTIGGLNSGMVEASKAIDTSRATQGFDWSDGLMNAVKEFGEFGKVLTQEENKMMVEAGDYIDKLMAGGMSLDKAVAQFTQSGLTTAGLRKKAAGWVENGALTKSANPFFSRTIEEGWADRVASEFEIQATANLDETISLAKNASMMPGVSHQDTMNMVISKHLTGQMDQSMFAQFTEYGSAVLRAKLEEKANKLAGIALTKAEDELSVEKINGEVDKFTSVIENTLKNVAGVNTATNALFGTSIPLDLDADELFKNTPIRQALASLYDNVYDVGTEAQRKDAIKNGVLNTMDDIYFNGDLDSDDKKELVFHMLEEARRARTNGGTGPHILSTGDSEFQAVVTRAKKIASDLDREKSYSNEDRIKGQEAAWGLIERYPFLIKPDMTDAEVSKRRDILAQLAIVEGGEYVAGLTTILERERRLETGRGAGEKPDKEAQDRIVSLETNPLESLQSLYASAPLGGSPKDFLEYARKNAASQEERNAIVKALNAHRKEANGHVTKMQTGWRNIVQSATNDAYTVAYADLDKDLVDVIPSEEQLRVEKSPHLLMLRRNLFQDILEGNKQPAEVFERLQASIANEWNDGLDTRNKFAQVKRDEAKERADAAATSAAVADREVDTEAWVGYGGDFAVNVPKDPLRTDGKLRLRFKPTKFNRLAFSGIFTDPAAIDKEFGEKPTTMVGKFISARPTDEDIKQVNEALPKWIDAQALLWWQENKSFHDEDVSALTSGDQHFVDYLREKYARETGTTTVDIPSRQGLPGRTAIGPTEALLNAYADKLENVGFGDDGILRINVEKIEPSWGALSVPELVEEDEIRALYPDTPVLEEAQLRYEKERQMLSTDVSGLKFVVGVGEDQKIYSKITNEIMGKPYLERQWESTLRTYRTFYGKNFDMRDEQARIIVGHIWTAFSNKERGREVDR